MSAVPPPVQITKPEQFDRLIARLSTVVAPGLIELVRSARRGEINLVQIDRKAVAPIRLMEQATRPVVCLIGDDDYNSSGPSGWHATRRLLWWAKAAMIHAAGSDARSYQAAIGMALSCRRCLLIETDTAHCEEWGDVLSRRHIPFLGLRPPGDGVHPVPLDRSRVQ